MKSAKKKPPKEQAKETQKFECDICKAKLATKRNLIRHIDVHLKAHLKKCPHCNFEARIDSVKRHEERVHKDTVNEAESTVELIEDDDEKEWKPEDHYEIADKRSFRSRKWKTTQVDSKITVKPLPAENWQEKLLRIMQHMLDTVRKNVPKGAMGPIAIRIDGLESAINKRTSKIELLNAQDLVDRIEAALNSNDEVDLTKGFHINIIYTDMPSGGARGGGRAGRRSFNKRIMVDTATWAFGKRSILDPARNAKDDLCLARCLVVSMAMANHDSIRDVNGSPVNFKYLYDSRKPQQGEFARQLHEDANVPEGKCGVPELQKFQDYLKDYQIIVFFEGDRIMFEGPQCRYRLLLFFCNDHFQVINPGMMKGYLGKDNYCPKCHDNWGGNGTGHKCSMSGCHLCKAAECQNTSEDKDVKICDQCDISFPSEGCFMEHLKEECQLFALCPNCKTKQFREKLDPPGFKPCISLPLPEDYFSYHNCLESRCRYCYKYYLPGHHPHCYVQKPTDKKKADQPDENAEEGVYELFGEREFVEGYEDDNLNESTKKKESSHKFIYADFEAETRRSRHYPNLLCLEDENGKKKTYKGPKCAERFVEDCFMKTKKRKRAETEDVDEGPRRKHAKEDIGFKNCTFVFHNFSGYDGYHVLKEIHKHKVTPSVIFRGSKLLSMRLPQRKIKFVDSLLHMPMPLSAMPKAYGFEDMKKGHFPYKMATKENRKYKGPFPPLEAFDVGNMTTKGRTETTEWHGAEKKRYDENGLIYDIDKENKEYCKNDVCIERKGVECYRQRMIDLFGLDPMEFCTLPSFCNHAYRKLHMKKNSIGIIPPRGYGTVNHSNPAIAWIEWHSHRLGLPIFHARNSAEIKIGKYKVDGFMFTHSGGGVVFEYHGCDFHGHSCKCDRTKTFWGQTLDERAEYTKEKEEFLEKLGYTVIKIYSCEFWKKFAKPDDVELEKDQETGNTEVDEALKEKIRAENWEMKEFVKPLLARLRKTTPLCPRDALRGGRTNCLRKFYKPSLLELIKYFDINSLYPSVNFSMNGELWPIGHPRKYLHSFPKVDEIFGLIKGTFKPPAELYHPVLGVQANGKLVYGLCKKCIHEGATQHCPHTEEERYIYGTYVSEEVKLALSKGYEIVSIDEVWHWPPEQQSTTLFRDFIARAYREKTEASGWPANIQAEIESHGLQDPEVQAEILVEGLEGKPIKDFPLKTRQLLEQKGRDHPDVSPLIEAYVAKVKAETDVEIRPEFVEKNPARRSAAKLVLNNFWGFWAKENNPDQTTYVKDIAEFYKLLATKDVGVYYPVNEDIMVVNWKELNQNERADPKANVVLAAFTTAYARIRLYSFLEVAQDRVLYMDTDSIIWIDRPGEPQIESGDLLGQMKDEILDEYGPNATISAYGGAGAKTYTLLITDKNTGEVIDNKRKMKGIRPTAVVDEQLPAEKLLDLIQKEYTVQVPQRILRRDKKEATLTWKEMSKVVRSTFSKRLPPKELMDCTDPIGSRSHELVPYVVNRQTELLLDQLSYL